MTAQMSKQLRDSVIKEVDSFSAHVQPMPIFTVMDRFVCCWSDKILVMPARTQTRT